jgi:hypothetical protein
MYPMAISANESIRRPRTNKSITNKLPLQSWQRECANYGAVYQCDQIGRNFTIRGKMCTNFCVKNIFVFVCHCSYLQYLNLNFRSNIFCTQARLKMCEFWKFLVTLLKNNSCHTAANVSSLHNVGVWCSKDIYMYLLTTIETLFASFFLLMVCPHLPAGLFCLPLLHPPRSNLSVKVWWTSLQHPPISGSLLSRPCRPHPLLRNFPTQFQQLQKCFLFCRICDTFLRVFDTSTCGGVPIFYFILYAYLLKATSLHIPWRDSISRTVDPDY